MSVLVVSPWYGSGALNIGRHVAEAPVGYLDSDQL